MEVGVQKLYIHLPKEYTSLDGYPKSHHLVTHTYCKHRYREAVSVFQSAWTKFTPSIWLGVKARVGNGSGRGPGSSRFGESLASLRRKILDSTPEKNPAFLDFF